MAAIYSGIHLKLKSPRTPWEDKLKLARFAWISSQCLLPNKEQVLLDWVSHALSGFYSQKVEFSASVLEGLWLYLDNLLHSRKLHALISKGKSINLRINVAQILLDRVQECLCGGGGAASPSSVSLSVLLSVSQGVLSVPSFSTVFTTKYELMADLLAKLCSVACRTLQEPLPVPVPTPRPQPITPSPLEDQPMSDPDTARSEPIAERPAEGVRSAQLFEVLLQVLSSYLSVQRQQSNPNRVFTVATNQLLQPILLLRHLLTSGEQHTHLHLRPPLSRDLRAKMDAILQSALFAPEHLASYKEELLPPNNPTNKEDSGKRGPGGGGGGGGGGGAKQGSLRPVSVVLAKVSAGGYCPPASHYAVKSSALPLLLRFCLESYGKASGGGGGGGGGGGRDEEEQRMLCFYFLTRLIPALGWGLGGAREAPPPPESWGLALLVLESLLGQTLAADVYNAAADRIRHGGAQLGFYRTLAQQLLGQAQPSTPAWYRCLNVLLGLNHLILEPDLDLLFSSAWVDSECMEPRVQRARQLLLSSLLHTYTKLRQLPHLFSRLLPVICRPAPGPPRPPLLSEGLCSSLSDCLLDTPPSQSLEICSLVLGSIRRYAAPLPGGGGGGDEEEEESGGGGENDGAMETECQGLDVDGDKGDASLTLLSLSQLLHALLFSVKTLDNASPLPLVQQTHSLMEETARAVTALLRLLASSSSSHEPTTHDKPSTTGPETEHECNNMEVSTPSSPPPRPAEPSLRRQSTLEAALLLRYSWVEMTALFHIHCSKYVEAGTPRGATAGSSPAAGASVLAHIEALLSGEILADDGARGFLLLPPTHPSPSPSSSSSSSTSSSSHTSRYLFKLLALQQLKKALLDGGPLLAEPGTTATLRRAARFLVAGEELEEEEEEEEEEEAAAGSRGRPQMWNGQMGSVSSSSYRVAHWYLVASNLPLIAPYLNAEAMERVADVLVGSLLSGQAAGGGTGGEPGVSLPGAALSVSLISSQLFRSPVPVESPSLYSAVVERLLQRMLGVLVAAGVLRVCPTLLDFHKVLGLCTGEKDDRVKLEALVEEMMMTGASQTGASQTAASQTAASQTGASQTGASQTGASQTGASQTGAAAAFVSLSDAQAEELLNLLRLASQLNPDGMNARDFSGLFLLLFLTLVFTSSSSSSPRPDGEAGTAADDAALDTGDDAPILAKLLSLLSSLLEGRNSPNVLKLLHGSTLLQVAVSSLLSRSDRGRLRCSSSSSASGDSHWSALLKETRGFVRSLVQLIVHRNSSVRLNLEQFTSFLLTAQEMSARQLAAVTGQTTPATTDRLAGVQLLLASLTALSQAMAANLGKSPQLDRTLTPLLTATTAAVGRTVAAVLKTQAVNNNNPAAAGAGALGQAFLVDVVRVMLRCELSYLSDLEDPGHMTLYRRFSQQLLREMNSGAASRPVDFLVSSLRFLSVFYRAVRRGRERENPAEEKEEEEERTRGEETDELYVHILLNVYKLLAAPWLSFSDVCELEPAVEELLRPLLERSSTEQFNQLLLLIRDGLDASKLRAGGHKEVLSAVTMVKLLSGCHLPEACSKALWLIAPQVISAMVFLVRASSQDHSLTLHLTVPTVTAMTALLRQGEGLISNPQHVTTALGALQLVPLDHLTPSVYQSAFLSVHEGLFTIIQCHPQVIQKAAPSFLNVFHRLVASVMYEGRQRGDSNTGPDSEVYVQCSRLVERMYSHIAAAPDSFSTLSAFMVAQYVTELQKVTLRPEVKSHLTEGVYLILDLCREQDVKFLSAGLQSGVREVFSELHGSYTHYHKAQRQGEEKYTA